MTHIRDANLRAYWEKVSLEIVRAVMAGQKIGEPIENQADYLAKRWLERFGDEQANDDWEARQQARAGGNEPEVGG